MLFRGKLSLIIIILILGLRTPFSFAQGFVEERFVYDSRGRRDPFVPLVDKDSPGGIRRSFLPPQIKVRLPVELKVEGILSRSGEYFAIINGQIKKRGEDIERIKIKEIEKDKVILFYEGREFISFLRKEKEK
jgi:hypothetical protein